MPSSTVFSTISRNDARRKAGALGVVLLALVWPSAEHLAAPPSGPLALLLALGGLLVFAWSERASGLAHWPARPKVDALNLAAVSSLAGWLFAVSAEPSRYIYGVAGACMLLPLVPIVRRSGFGRSLALGGVVLTIGGASTVVLKQVAWRLHEIPLWKAAPGLQVWTGERLATVGLTFEALGLFALWYVLVGLGVLTAMSGPDGSWRARARTLACAVGVLVGYATLRLALTVVLAIEFDQPGLVWHSGYTVASWLPLSLLLPCPHRPCQSPLFIARAAAAPSGASAAAALRPRRSSLATWLGPGAAVGAGFCLAFALAYNDPGVVKAGRVLFDEGHANWEWTEEPFDTSAFGIRAEYNYYCLREFLGHFYAVSTSSAGILPAVLENVDVLVVRTPTAPYSDREIATIVEFVKNGGGLLLIGDHTNLFGMTTYLNAIAGRFGMSFRTDDTFDLATTGFSTYAAIGPALGPGLHPTLGPAQHPALCGVRRFDFLTSCTITGGAQTEPAIIGYGLASEDGAYSHPNFFGNIAFDLCDRFGLFLQAASRRLGKGRVFLFTDSTCFSNFCLFSAGKPELIVGAVDYLNRRGSRCPCARQAGLILAVGLAAVGLLCRNRLRARLGAPLLTAPWLGALAGLFLGIPLTADISARAYGPVRPVLSLSRIIFDTEHSGASFFDYLGVASLPASRHFEEFYLCAQRLGLHPKGGTIGDLETDRPIALVIVNPDRHFVRTEIDRVCEYVSSGGTLLVLDSVTNSESTAGDIVRPFGLEIGVVPAVAAAALDTAGLEVVPTLQVFASSSDRVGNTGRRVENTSGEPHIAVVKAGSGTVIVATDAFRYSSAVLGKPLERRSPPERCREIYREVFALYARLSAECLSISSP